MNQQNQNNNNTSKHVQQKLSVDPPQLVATLESMAAPPSSPSSPTSSGNNTSHLLLPQCGRIPDIGQLLRNGQLDDEHACYMFRFTGGRWPQTTRRRQLQLIAETLLVPPNRSSSSGPPQQQEAASQQHHDHSNGSASDFLVDGGEAALHGSPTNSSSTNNSSIPSSSCTVRVTVEVVKGLGVMIERFTHCNSEGEPTGAGDDLQQEGGSGGARCPHCTCRYAPLCRVIRCPNTSSSSSVVDSVDQLLYPSHSIDGEHENQTAEAERLQHTEELLQRAAIQLVRSQKPFLDRTWSGLHRLLHGGPPPLNQQAAVHLLAVEEGHSQSNTMMLSQTPGPPPLEAMLKESAPVQQEAQEALINEHRRAQVHRLEQQRLQRQHLLQLCGTLQQDLQSMMHDLTNGSRQLETVSQVQQTPFNARCAGLRQPPPSGHPPPLEEEDFDPFEDGGMVFNTPPSWCCSPPKPNGDDELAGGDQAVEEQAELEEQKEEGEKLPPRPLPTEPCGFYTEDNRRVMEEDMWRRGLANWPTIELHPAVSQQEHGGDTPAYFGGVWLTVMVVHPTTALYSPLQSTTTLPAGYRRGKLPRSRLVQYLDSICYYLQIQRRTYHQAVQLFDRFMHRLTRFVPPPAPAGDTSGKPTKSVGSASLNTSLDGSFGHQPSQQQQQHRSASAPTNATSQQSAGSSSTTPLHAGQQPLKQARNCVHLDFTSMVTAIDPHLDEVVKNLPIYDNDISRFLQYVCVACINICSKYHQTAIAPMSDLIRAMTNVKYNTSSPEYIRERELLCIAEKIVLNAVNFVVMAFPTPSDITSHIVKEMQLSTPKQPLHNADQDHHNPHQQHLLLPTPPIEEDCAFMIDAVMLHDTAPIHCLHSFTNMWDTCRAVVQYVCHRTQAAAEGVLNNTNDPMASPEFLRNFVHSSGTPPDGAELSAQKQRETFAALMKSYLSLHHTVERSTVGQAAEKAAASSATGMLSWQSGPKEKRACRFFESLMKINEQPENEQGQSMRQHLRDVWTRLAVASERLASCSARSQCFVKGYFTSEGCMCKADDASSSSHLGAQSPPPAATMELCPLVVDEACGISETWLGLERATAGHHHAPTIHARQKRYLDTNPPLNISCGSCLFTYIVAAMFTDVVQVRLDEVRGQRKTVSLTMLLNHHQHVVPERVVNNTAAATELTSCFVPDMNIGLSAVGYLGPVRLSTQMLHLVGDDTIDDTNVPGVCPDHMGDHYQVMPYADATQQPEGKWLSWLSGRWQTMLAEKVHQADIVTESTRVDGRRKNGSSRVTMHGLPVAINGVLLDELQFWETTAVHVGVIPPPPVPRRSASRKSMLLSQEDNNKQKGCGPLGEDCQQNPTTSTTNNTTCQISPLSVTLSPLSPRPPPFALNFPPPAAPAAVASSATIAIKRSAPVCVPPAVLSSPAMMNASSTSYESSSQLTVVADAAPGLSSSFQYHSQSGGGGGLSHYHLRGGQFNNLSQNQQQQAIPNNNSLAGRSSVSNSSLLQEGLDEKYGAFPPPQLVDGSAVEEDCLVPAIVEQSDDDYSHTATMNQQQHIQVSLYDAMIQGRFVVGDRHSVKKAQWREMMMAYCSGPLPPAINDVRSGSSNNMILSQGSASTTTACSSQRNYATPLMVQPSSTLIGEMERQQRELQEQRFGGVMVYSGRKLEAGGGGGGGDDAFFNDGPMMQSVHSLVAQYHHHGEVQQPPPAGTLREYSGSKREFDHKQQHRRVEGYHANSQQQQWSQQSSSQSISIPSKDTTMTLHNNNTQTSTHSSQQDSGGGGGGGGGGKSLSASSSQQQQRTKTKRSMATQQSTRKSSPLAPMDVWPTTTSSQSTATSAQMMNNQQQDAQLLAKRARR